LIGVLVLVLVPAEMVEEGMMVVRRRRRRNVRMKRMMKWRSDYGGDGDGLMMI
jgi:hypothetical protein